MYIVLVYSLVLIYSQSWQQSPQCQNLYISPQRNLCLLSVTFHSHLLFSHQVVSDSFETPQTVSQQAPLSMEKARQEYWSGLPFISPGDLPEPGIELVSLVPPALAGGFFTTEPPEKPLLNPVPTSCPTQPLIIFCFLWSCCSGYLIS